MNPYLKLMRPINCVMASIAIIMVGIIVKGYALADYWIQIILGMLVVFFAVAGGNALNDYYDREVDLINHPNRPIPSGKIKPKNALIFGISMFILALIFSSLINWITLTIAVIAELAMYLYESNLKNKGLSGNSTISILVALIFIFGAAIFGEEAVIRITIFALMAFSSNMGREIVKDIEDMEGDINRITLPKKAGKKTAGAIAFIFFILAVSLSPLPYICMGFSVYYLLTVLISDAIFIYAGLIQFKNPRRGQKYAKLAMIVGLIAYMVGGLT